MLASRTSDHVQGTRSVPLFSWQKGSRVCAVSSAHSMCTFATTSRQSLYNLCSAGWTHRIEFHVTCSRGWAQLSHHSSARGCRGAGAQFSTECESCKSHIPSCDSTALFKDRKEQQVTDLVHCLPLQAIEPLFTATSSDIINNGTFINNEIVDVFLVSSTTAHACYSHQPLICHVSLFATDDSLSPSYSRFSPRAMTAIHQTVSCNRIMVACFSSLFAADSICPLDVQQR